MEDTQTFLRSLMFGDGFLQLSFGYPDNAKYTKTPPIFNGNVPKDIDIYFSPALRRREGSEKDDVLGAAYLWADNDDEVLPEPTFPPSVIIWSGHGYHLYWRLLTALEDRERIETLNKILIADIPTADKACWNANRLMRLPGTYNQPDAKKGETEPVLAEFRHTRFDIEYTAEDIEVLGRLDDVTRHRIRTGSAERFDSRSERDWAVMRQLVLAGASDTLIELLFREMPIGDKYREHNAPEHYLTHTLNRVRRDVADNPPTPEEIESLKRRKEKRRGVESKPITIQEKEDGYYMVGTTSRRASTFTLEPKVLLDGSHFKSVDAIVCDVRAGDRIWADVTFSRAAFRSVAMMDAECPNAEWQWLGTDSDVRLLLPYLMEKLRTKGMPAVAATSTLGLHFIDNKPLFLGDTETLGSDGYWQGTGGKLTWLPVDVEHPRLTLAPSIDKDELAFLRDNLFRLNTPCTMWAMIGWYAASCLKPWLEIQGFRFPILNITGTKGSGKTTLSQRVLMPLFGQVEPRGYDAGTTNFVMLALLGSSNAVPIAFSEFRYDSVEKFLRTILMAYDTGHSPRGRADQTTKDWPLSAPFSIDGEDVISDGASRERIIIARFRPDTIREGTDAHAAFYEIRRRLPVGFAGYHIQRCLELVESGNAFKLLREAHGELQDAFPITLPDRVRNNYTVVMFGAKLFAAAVGMEAPAADVLKDSIGEVVNITSGRARSLIDEFVEEVANAVTQVGYQSFAWDYDRQARVLYFQMSSAHAWWLRKRKVTGRSALEREAMTAQLREASYARHGQKRKEVWMYGVSLPDAYKTGLDLPEDLPGGQITLNI